MKGWKTKLGGILKGIGGAALGVVSTALPDLISGAAGSGTKFGAGLAIALTLIGDALQRAGIGHKLDKNTEAVKTPEAVKVVDARNKDILDR